MLTVLGLDLQSHDDFRDLDCYRREKTAAWPQLPSNMTCRVRIKLQKSPTEFGSLRRSNNDSLQSAVRFGLHTLSTAFEPPSPSNFTLSKLSSLPLYPRKPLVKGFVDASCQSDKAQIVSKIDAETSVIIAAPLDGFAVNYVTEMIASAGRVERFIFSLNEWPPYISQLDQSL